LNQTRKVYACYTPSESEPVQMRQEVVLRGQLTQDGQCYGFQVDQHGRLSLLE